MGLLRPLCLSWLLLAACDRGAHGAPAASGSALPPLAHLAPVPSVALEPVSTDALPDYAELVRRERWADAQAALAALPEAKRAEPELRFLRARVALELNDARSALGLLLGLETAIPNLAPQIAAARARAQLEVGPFLEAARYFEQRAEPEALLSAASAYEREGASAKARSALDRLLSRLGKTNRSQKLEVRARALRADLALRVGDVTTANADQRWLALTTPLRPEADAALQALQGREGAPRLSKAEHLARASILAEAGRVEASEAELGYLSRAPGAAPSRGRLTYLRAFALYAARSKYAEAAELFERAARESPEDAPRALFYAARALSRAQLDERAIAGYERVSRAFPKTGWGEQAQYLSARLRFIAGQYSKARAAYDTYLTAFGKKARFGSDALYERALCALETDQPLAAARSFSRLALRTNERRAKARFRYLEALALAEAKQIAPAVLGFSEVARSEALSFFGLAARARLVRLGAELPPLLAESAESPATPLSLLLPSDVAALARLGLARDAERNLSQKELVLERQYMPRGKEALCEAYGSLGVAQRRYRVAQDAIRGAALESAPTAANSWAWRCIYPTPYEGLVQDAAQREGLPASFIFAVMRQESAFDPAAGSPAGACGLLQLILPTARRVAASLQEPFQPESRLNPELNVRYGAHYLAQLYGYFGGNSALVAAAYNAGPEAVFRWLDAPEKIGVDAFVARIPFEETRSYVERVLGNFARYQYLAGGASAVTSLNLDLPPAPTRPADLF